MSSSFCASEWQAGVMAESSSSARFQRVESEPCRGECFVGAARHYSPDQGRAWFVPICEPPGLNLACGCTRFPGMQRSVM